jgi:hypothetical protein
MTEEPKRPRDELADLIATGKLDDPKVIAGVLLRMTAALNDIKDQLAGMKAQLDEIETQFGWLFVDATIDEIQTIQVDLRDSTLFHGKIGPVARARAFLQRQVEKDLPWLGERRRRARARARRHMKPITIEKIEDDL